MSFSMGGLRVTSMPRNSVKAASGTAPIAEGVLGALRRGKPILMVHMGPPFDRMTQGLAGVEALLGARNKQGKAGIYILGRYPGHIKNLPAVEELQGHNDLPSDWAFLNNS